MKRFISILFVMTIIVVSLCSCGKQTLPKDICLISKESHVMYDADGILFSDITNYEYDGKGNLLKKDYSSDSIVTSEKYEYDEDGRIIYEESKSEDGSIDYMASYVYDENGYLIKSEIKDSGDVVIIDYINDSNGNPILVTENSQNSHSEKVYTYEYGYDDQNRIIKQKQYELQNGSDNYSLLSETSYQFDSNGNMVKENLDTESGYMHSEYIFNSNNQIVTEIMRYCFYEVANVEECVRHEYSYDKNGNIVLTKRYSIDNETGTEFCDYYTESTYDEHNSLLTEKEYSFVDSDCYELISTDEYEYEYITIS